jgi:di/tricarboxylate transporter
VIIVASLFIVVEAVEKCHIVEWLARKTFRVEGSVVSGKLNLYVLCFLLSIFLNNTPLVAIMLPVVKDWGRMRNIEASQLLMPVSYSVLAGSFISMIGTSTNLTVQGLMQADRNYSFSFFAPAPIGIPLFVALLLYQIYTGPVILPDKLEPKHTSKYANTVKNTSCSDFMIQLQIAAPEDTVEDPFCILNRENDSNSSKCPSKKHNQTLGQLTSSLGLSITCVQKVTRGNLSIEQPTPDMPVTYHDRIHCSSAKTVTTKLLKSIAGEGTNLLIYGCPASSLHIKAHNKNSTIFRCTGIWLPTADDRGSSDDANECKSSDEENDTEDENDGEDKEDARFIECVVKPQSSLIDHTPEEVGAVLFTQCHGARLVGVRTGAAGTASANASLLPDTAFAARHLQCACPLGSSRASNRYNPLMQRSNSCSEHVSAQKPADGGDRPGEPLGLLLLVPPPRNGRSTSSITGARGNYAILTEDEENGSGSGSGSGSGNVDDLHSVALTPLEARTNSSNYMDCSPLLRPCDTILCIGNAATRKALQESGEFLSVHLTGPPVPEKPSLFSMIPVLSFVGALVAVASGVLSMAVAALVLTALCLLGGWVKINEVPKLVDVRLLLMIGSSISFAGAVTKTGLAARIALAIGAAQPSPLAALFLIYALTLLVTELISNNAAAALMYPVAVSLADELHVSFKPFAMCVLIASTAGFMSPVGYQTHMMVWGPGNYKMKDFLLFGIVPDILYCIGTCLLTPIIYPF